MSPVVELKTFFVEGTNVDAGVRYDHRVRDGVGENKGEGKMSRVPS